MLPFPFLESIRLSSMSAHPVPRSSWMFPAAAVAFVAVTGAMGIGFTPSVSGLVFSVILLAILFGTVFAAVHHAEVIAHKIGEPYGTLLLTLSVIIIEVAVIATIMIGDKSAPTLARDTVFAVVMIVCNGMVGLCILAGGLRYSEQEFQVSGAKIYLSVLIVLSTITLILPNYTLATPGPLFSALQLAFVSVVTMILYGLFLYTQTVLHRDYFINDDDDEDGAAPTHSIVANSVLLVVSLVTVVLLAKSFSVVVDAGGAAIGAPAAFTGIVVALLVLMPEGLAAFSAARHNKLQKSINLSLGGRGGCDAARQAAGARPAAERDDAADHDIRHQHADIRHRRNQHPVRHGAYVGVCCIPAHGIRTVIKEASDARCPVRRPAGHPRSSRHRVASGAGRRDRPPYPWHGLCDRAGYHLGDDHRRAGRYPLGGADHHRQILFPQGRRRA
jgi:Ca2+:H+ antiporter